VALAARGEALAEEEDLGGAARGGATTYCS
jgi:hypothetical protein